MNRHKGLLAFLCMVVAVACAVLQVPIVSGIEEIGQVFSDNPRKHPMTLALTPPTASSMETTPGGSKRLTLHKLKRERRADQEIRQLAKTHGLPFGVLKAHLAVSSHWILDERGMYWSRLAEGEDEVKDDGPTRTKAAASLLGRYRKHTGTVTGALMAWEAGPTRAKLVARKAGPSLDSHMASLRKHMLTPLRSDARRWACTVWGLGVALESRWPVESTDLSKRAGAGVFLNCPANSPVFAPMEGTVSWASKDGTRGICVEIVHACDLRTEICDLKKSTTAKGKRVKPGSQIGSAGAKPPLFNLWLGNQAADVMVLLPADEPSS